VAVSVPVATQVGSKPPRVAKDPVIRLDSIRARRLREPAARDSATLAKNGARRRHRTERDLSDLSPWAPESGFIVPCAAGEIARKPQAYLAGP